MSIVSNGENYNQRPRKWREKQLYTHQKLVMFINLFIIVYKLLSEIVMSINHFKRQSGTMMTAIIKG